VKKHFPKLNLSLAMAGGVLLLFVNVACERDPSESPMKSESTTSASAVPIPEEHVHMRRLIENAFLYLDPAHGMIDPDSGYLREGWNEDAERGLFLRSFTQITAIGEWIELLANIAAGQADNPVISREQALEQLEETVATLREDQQNPALGSKGLLVNFLGLEGGARVGPLAQSVLREDFLEAFGEDQGAAIWEALLEAGWMESQNEGTQGLVKRSEEFGANHFKGALQPYADETTIRRIMDILDQRVVLVAYGDNANLTASVAKAIGALLNPNVEDVPAAIKVRGDLEAFLDAQGEGYRGLIDEAAGMFSFGRDEATGRFFGWNNSRGDWVIGHQDYFVNEFRDPSMFLITRFDLPVHLLGNLGFKMKSYETQEGRTLFTLAPFAGSAFQVFGLDLGMPHLDYSVWRMLLENAAEIEVDYASREGHPGFLSESYSGEGTEYTGEVGMPGIAVAGNRITTAPSLYTIGTAYQIAPDEVNAFVETNWPIIETLLTDHGPWEGYHMPGESPIEFQTTAHTLSLILGALGKGPENMRRYIEAKGLGDKLGELYRSGPAVDFLAKFVEVAPWAADGAAIRAERNEEGVLEVRSDSKTVAGVIFNLPPGERVSLSGGVMELRYRSAQPIGKVTIVPKRKEPLSPGVIQNEIFAAFKDTGDGEETLIVPLPTTPGLDGVATVEVNFEGGTTPNTFSITDFRFKPLTD
jgi:hypothetical protein